uniref:Protein transport protein Sec24A-like n=1 Tax=Castor canadensis TaxID=51338 RepID=A0A8B7W3L4_CASCN|nr:protein transport protein Sec24A-like [Castor canadensis]XP_020038755.1 protein transport protein Sec24A-like [Castor canadensis]XP_020038756.1 protein transport protein Sec24A-like [Castor canadensis]XP_020038757.1 protein transport protein Sec24A-like [Castor canadensis]
MFNDNMAYAVRPCLKKANKNNIIKKKIHLTPSSDFYKKLALDCSGQQVAVDLLLLSGQYSDWASPGERRIRVHTLCLPVVLTLNEVFLGADVQAISGLLANMDFLSLPNVNPDARYTVQMSAEKSLPDMQLGSFQSALLYTSSKGERRILSVLCVCQ